MAAPMKVAAGLIIFRRMSSEIQYLLLQTSYGTHHWTPPKGHVDPGEDLRTTAIRETEEEAGLHEKEYKILEDFEKTLHYNVNGKPKKVVYWLAELLDPNTGIKLSDEHQAFKWLGLKDALEYSGFADMQEVLKIAHKYLES